VTARAILFTKPATPGRVKTRLAATVGAERAAEMHRAFVGDVAERLRDQESFRLDLAWALDDVSAPPDWPETRGLHWRRQEGADLGSRLFHALSDAARSGHSVAAVGSDHPEIGAETVAEAFQHIRPGDARSAGGTEPAVDMVLGPAADGGYYLIALHPGAVHPRLFEDIDWSTPRVRAQTLERAAELGLRVLELEVGHDIDREADLRRLAARLQAGELECPRSRRLLVEWGWIGGGESPCES